MWNVNKDQQDNKLEPTSPMTTEPPTHKGFKT